MLDERLLAFFRAAEKPDDLDDLQQTIETSDVVFGVFEDKEAEQSIGYFIIKGEGLFDAVKYTGQPQGVSINAVRCDSLEEAKMMRQVFGDAAIYH